jgi:hypothetical protein
MDTHETVMLVLCLLGILFGGFMCGADAMGRLVAQAKDPADLTQWEREAYDL